MAAAAALEPAEDQGAWVDHTLATAFEAQSRRLEAALLSLLAALKEDSRAVDAGGGVSLLLRLHWSAGDGDDDEFSSSSFARRWFGVKGWFFTLVAVATQAQARGNEKTRPTRDSCAYWLSALSVALAAVDCRLPGFVASRPSLYGTYVGMSAHHAYDSLVLQDPPNEGLTRLDGVQRHFALRPSKDDVMATVRFSWTVTPPRPGLLSGLVVSALWPTFVKGTHADNEFHSTLVPEQAPVWTVAAMWACEAPAHHKGKGHFAGSEPLSLKALALSDLATGRSSVGGVNWKAALSELGLDGVARRVSDGLLTAHYNRIVASALSRPSPLGEMALAINSLESATHALREFCVHLRRRFEAGMSILVQAENPQPNRCLAMQKLQLLSLCVSPASEAEFAASAQADLGRKSKLSFTIKATGEVAYEPETQSRDWLTRDDAADRLDGEARAEYLSPMLVSDMRAFKAANPGCDLADFLKWFSPKDVDADGNVSRRMASGLWASAWERAQPLCARDQKPLFDRVVEGEKALHWFETLSAEDFVSDALIPEGEIVLAQMLAEHVRGTSDEALLQRDCSIDTLLAVETRLCFCKALRSSGIPENVAAGLEQGDGKWVAASSLKSIVPSDRPETKEYVCMGVESGDRLYVKVQGGEFRQASAFRL